MTLRRTIHVLLFACFAMLQPLLLTAAESKSPSMLLDQGWNASQREFYYHTSQGSYLMPAVFLESLGAARGGRFMAEENLKRFGWIYDNDSNAKNPYGWPLGFAIDTRAPGPAQAGLTCAACHTGQVTFRGTRVRIDGGQANIDFNPFLAELVKAVADTGVDTARRARFVERATLLGYPKDRVVPDFDSLRAAFQAMGERTRQLAPHATVTGAGRLDAVSDIANQVFATSLAEPANAQPEDAPSDFPYLWDMWLFDRVQYNGSVREPMSRNMTEVLGVGGMHLTNPNTGKLLPEAERWKTTIAVRNLHAIEKQLQTLKAPPWPEDLLGKINRKRAAKGRALFAENCSGCHGIQIVKTTHDPREWHVPIVRLDKIGTDPNNAVNFAQRRYDASKLGAGTLGAPEGLRLVVDHVKPQAYADAGITPEERIEFDGRRAENNPNLAPCGYKARPLIGVWATPPFLHNGAVPSVYDLLSEKRPAMFRVGGNEYDPAKLGLGPTTADNATVFDPKQPGNSNQGHWWTNDTSRPGRIGRALGEEERYALIEYLKAATPQDYPVREIDVPAPSACTSDRDWAERWPKRAVGELTRK